MCHDRAAPPVCRVGGARSSCSSRSLVLASLPAVGGQRRTTSATQFHVDFTLNRDGSVDVAEHLTWQFPQGQAAARDRAARRACGSATRTAPTSTVSTRSAASRRARPSGAPAAGVGERRGRRRVGADPGRRPAADRLGHPVVRRALPPRRRGQRVPGPRRVLLEPRPPGDTQVYQHVTATVTGPGAAATAPSASTASGARPSRCTATPGAAAQFSAPDLQPGQGVSILVSLPRSAFGALDPVLRQGSRQRLRWGEHTRSRRRCGGARARRGAHAAAAGGGTDGHPRLHPRQGRALRRASRRACGRGMGDSGAVVARAESRSSPCSSLRPRVCSPGWSAPSSTRRPTRSTSRRRSSTWRCAGTSPSEPSRGRAQGLAADAHATPRRVSRRCCPTRWRCYEGVFAAARCCLSELRNEFKPTLDRVQSLMYDEVVRRGWFRRSPQAQRAGWTALGGRWSRRGCSGSSGWVAADATGSGPWPGCPCRPGSSCSGGRSSPVSIVVLLGRRMAYRTADGSAVLAQSGASSSTSSRRRPTRSGGRRPRTSSAATCPTPSSSAWPRSGPRPSSGSPSRRPPPATSSRRRSGISAGATARSAASPTAWTRSPARPGGTFASTPGGSGGSGFSSGGGFSGGGGGGSSGGSW